ncbi:MAG TPA: PEGA domain-containing protein, partial [bacterium]|nr:PEGA domain-containing protein [bacterium]
MRRFLVITLCILFSLSLLSDYSIANTLIYADISPPNEYINETLIALVNMGSLYVDSTPRGASIYLDNIYEGETPRRIDSIPAGIHTLRLSKDGYRDYVQQVRIDAQQTANIQISLTPGYSLTVNSTPRGAMVYIDGIFKGITPV